MKLFIFCLLMTIGLNSFIECHQINNILLDYETSVKIQHALDSIPAEKIPSEFRNNNDDIDK